MALVRDPSIFDLTRGCSDYHDNHYDRLDRIDSGSQAASEELRHHRDFVDRWRSIEFEDLVVEGSCFGDMAASRRTDRDIADAVLATLLDPGYRVSQNEETRDEMRLVSIVG